MKGVASRTVARLMACVPEIGQLSNKKISKLCGLAPIADDSCKRTGKRSIKGGRSSPRSILYHVAVIAARYDDNLGKVQQRLRAAGKAKMVIRIALGRKLLVILNAKARDARKAIAVAADIPDSRSSQANLVSPEPFGPPSPRWAEEGARGQCSAKNHMRSPCFLGRGWGGVFLCNAIVLRPVAAD
jgi:transposase